MPQFEIEGRLVGADHAPLVIVEVGINHEGDFDKAIAMVDAAVAAGAEVVKFQCHITEKEMVPTDMKPGEISDERLWDIIKRCELTEDEERRVQAYCREKGTVYLSTPFSREAADRLHAMGVPAFKIGSGECNNLPLLRHIAKLGKPIILSTGMNDLASVRRSVAAIREFDVPLALMHCTSMYPTPYEKVRLGGVTELREAFPDIPIGLSDHSLNIWTCLGAVSLGAGLLEKHFTVSRSWPGPDTPISIEPDELSDLIEGSEAIWMARGGGKTRLPEEQPVIDFAYATVVTTAPVRTGEPFSEANTWVKRPGTGPIQAERLQEVIGKAATRDLPADVHIQPGDIEGFAA
ncbi:N-acetylneuraminate synthase family protein [Algihabitans albus]|uniref:N-acetylneuraminate synthase family protein n=1 Tax=Algihabitans albus TaxID=2164067 RepID=UPI000E5CFA61|nr:N-acetylneuraminate synthase family protein [Algihabitans albus]